MPNQELNQTVPPPEEQRQEPPTRRTKPITIAIRVVQGRVTLSERVPLNLQNLEEARWTSTQGEVDIIFAPNGSPFWGTRFRVGTGGATLSGLPVRGRAGRTYAYTVVVTTRTGVFVTQTPAITVGNATQPSRPAGQKAAKPAAKKASTKPAAGKKAKR